MTTDEPDNLNPYYGKVIGFIADDGSLEDSAADGAEYSRLLINVGSDDDVEVGENVLIFALGREIIDPETGNTLGCFEIVRGEAKVSSVQRKMAIIKSRKLKKARRLKHFTSGSTNRPEFEEITITAPFTAPEIGDFVRFI